MSVVFYHKKKNSCSISACVFLKCTKIFYIQKNDLSFKFKIEIIKIQSDGHPRFYGALIKLKTIATCFIWENSQQWE